MTTSKNNTNLTNLVSIIKAATSSTISLLDYCRDNTANATKRATIASACDIIIAEHRELLAIDKGFKTFAAYDKALLARIEANAKGAKNERKNALGIKCGHAKNKMAFYHVVNSALHEAVSPRAKYGYMLAVPNADNGYKFEVVARVKTNKVVNNPSGQKEEKAASKEGDAAKVEVAISTEEKSPLATASDAIAALNDTDLNTLASAMMSGANVKMAGLMKAIILLQDQKMAEKAALNFSKTELVDAELLATKQKLDIKLAVDQKLGKEIVAKRKAALKATNIEIANLMNIVKPQEKITHMESKF